MRNQEYKIYNIKNIKNNYETDAKKLTGQLKCIKIISLVKQ